MTTEGAVKGFFSEAEYSATYANVTGTGYVGILRARNKCSESRCRGIFLSVLDKLFCRGRFLLPRKPTFLFTRSDRYVFPPLNRPEPTPPITSVPVCRAILLICAHPIEVLEGAENVSKTLPRWKALQVVTVGGATPFWAMSRG